MYDVKEKKVLVTGGASGIGAAIVQLFLQAGAQKIVILDVNETAGKALEDTLNKKYAHEKVTFLKCDITTADLEEAFDTIVSKFKYIDVVVNNAAILNDSPEHFVREIEINVTALIKSSLKAYNLMRKDKGGNGGTIINISSGSALGRFTYLPVYSATKSAVLQFSNCLGSEPHYGRSAVRVLTICFGPTQTSMMTAQGTKIDEETDQEFLQIIKTRILQSPESAAKGVLEAYKLGASASTWLVTLNRPAKNITNQINEAHQIMLEGLLQ